MLYLLNGPLGFSIKAATAAAGGYNIGQGAKRIAGREYLHGSVQVVNGTLMVAGTLSAQSALSGKSGTAARHLNNENASKPITNNLKTLSEAEKKISARLAERDKQLGIWKNGFNNRVRKGQGLFDASRITVQIGNRTVKPVEGMSLRGTPVYSGVSDKEIFALYEKLTGHSPNFRTMSNKGQLANGYITTGTKTVKQSNNTTTN